MWETRYPILAPDRYHFLLVLDLLFCCGFEFTIFRRHQKIYVLYMYDAHDYEFMCELIGIMEQFL